MTKLDQLQQEIHQAQMTLVQLQGEAKAANEAVMNNPSDGDLALRAAALDKQLESAENALTRAQEAAKAEAERLKSPEAKAELKRYEALIKDGDKLQAEIIEAAEALGDKLEELKTRWKEAGALARRYGQPEPKWMSGAMMSNLYRDVLRYVRMRHSWERAKEIAAQRNGGASLANPKKALFPN